MTEFKNKLEVLELIAKSDKILATEKFCIFSTILPKEIKRDLLNQVTGMVNMAESMTELLVNKQV